MKKEVSDFQKAAAERNITRWNIHNCSMCGYACGYVIQGNAVAYDSGCNCVTYGPVIDPSSWEALADHYNNNAGGFDAQERCEKYPRFVGVIKRSNELWGFENPAFLTEQTVGAKA